MKTPNPTALALCAILGLFTFSCQKTITEKPPVVNAGTSQTITSPVDVTLSGYATDSSSAIVAYLWSQISGPNTAFIEDPGSKTTLATGLQAGTYVFQLEATDANGLTGVDTMSVSVGNVKNTTPVMLAPVHNLYEFTYIGNSTEDVSEGVHPPELGAEAWTINGVQVDVRSVFKFDLSTLANANIGKAQLSLYSNPTPYTANLTTPNYGPTNQFNIMRVNDAWDPNTTTWATQPSVDTTNQVLIPQTSASSLDLPNIDVTAMVKSMLANGNNGFEIRLQNEQIYNSRIFCSSSYSDTTKVPTLYITY